MTERFHYLITEPDFNSDHCLATFIGNTPIKGSNVSTNYSFCKKTYSPEHFCNDLLKADWRPLYCKLNANEKLEEFQKIFLIILLKHAPYRKFYRKNIMKNSKRIHTELKNKPWIDPQLLSLINQNHKLYRNYKPNGKPSA